MTDRGRLAVTVLVATVAFALALALRERADPWRTTAIAAIAAIGLSAWSLGPRLPRLFAVTARPAITAVALGGALVVATHLAFHLILVASPSLAASIRALYASVEVGAHPVTLAILTTTVVVGEELVWRGVAVELAGANRSKPVVAGISVAAYALPQLAGGVPLLLAAATGLGAVFAAQRLATGRLVEPILTHVVWSVSVFVVFPLA